MNHILVRNKNTGSALAPQGVDRYYPYAENLTIAQGNALLAADLTAGLALAKLIEAMPGTNRIRATDTPTGPATPVLLYIGRNGSGNGMGSLSPYTNGPGTGGDLFVLLVATGSTPAYSTTPVKMVYSATGWPRDGLIPVSDVQHYACLLGDVPNGTYRLEVRQVTTPIYRVNIEVTDTGPELAVTDSGLTTTPPPPAPSGSSDSIAIGRDPGTPPTPEPGTDFSGIAFNTTVAP